MILLQKILGLIPFATRLCVKSKYQKCDHRFFRIAVSALKSNVYEPDYLESLKPKYPQYESLNVQLKGYDYPILENYQRYLHNVADYMGIEVEDCYAMPPQQMSVQRLRPKSSMIEAEYSLTIYERNLQLQNVNAPHYPLFLRIAHGSLPEGVELTIQEHTDEVEERRYVPDRDLLDLKSELEKMQSGSGTKKK